MNLKYKINQLRNVLKKPALQAGRWIFVYGVPRSGTTFFYHALLQEARSGISDYDLGVFLPPIAHIEKSGYIPINTEELKHFLQDQLSKNAAPGGGRRYDFIVKQVNTSLEEFELIKDLMGNEPLEKFFLYREPLSWLPSALKKFNINEIEAIKMYENSLASYQQIGGKALAYGQEINSQLSTLNIDPIQAFAEKELDRNQHTLPELITAFDAFKMQLSKQQ
jgi:hypothetical protein